VLGKTLQTRALAAGRSASYWRCDGVAGSEGTFRGVGAARLGPMTVDRAAGNRLQEGALGPGHATCPRRRVNARPVPTATRAKAGLSNRAGPMVGPSA